MNYTTKVILRLTGLKFWLKYLFYLWPLHCIVPSQNSQFINFQMKLLVSCANSLLDCPDFSITLGHLEWRYWQGSQVKDSTYHRAA